MSAFPDTPVTMLARMAARVSCCRDESAWVRLFELYEPVIRRFAEQHGEKSDAEDVAQEIFLKLVRVIGGGSFKVGSDAPSFRSYLVTLIRRELVSRWRKVQARDAGRVVPLDDPESPVEIPVASEVEATLDIQWRLARRQAAVDHALTRTALSAQSRAIYRAYVLEEHPIDEVAERFGVPNNTVSQVKARVNRMIEAIEREYGE